MQPVTLDVPGYAAGLHVGVPTTNDVGGYTGVSQSFKIPPVVWMVVFLTVGYIGLRMLLD